MKHLKISKLIICAAAAIICTSSALARAETAPPGRRLALIMGASDYAILPNSTPGVVSDLASVPHDVARMIRAAHDLGVSDRDMTVLADHLDPSETKRKADGVATRREILDALKALADKAKAGDQVLVYFSGHGAQQPDKDDAYGLADEPDGLDELILPVDVTYWGDKAREVPGAITDDAIGRAVSAIRAKGAFVWLMVDACHSGTTLRGGPMVQQPGVETKAISSAILRIPTKAIAEAQRRAALRGRSGGVKQGALDSPSAEQGGFVAFYAAGPDQLALAQIFKEAPVQSLGMLTFAVTQAIAAGHASSYRDLATMVQGVYAVPVYNDGKRQPGFDGELDRAILGWTTTPPREWNVRRESGQLVLDGGLLDGVHVGDILGVRYAQQSDVIGYLRVDSSQGAQAKLSPIDYQGRTASAVASQIGPNFSFVATRAAAGVAMTVRIGRPPISANPSALDTLLQNALDLVAADPTRTPGVKLEFSPAGTPADVYLRAGRDRIWFADQPEGFDREGRNQPPWLDVDGSTRLDDFAEQLAQRLRLYARSTTLQRAMTAFQLGEARKTIKIDFLIDRPSESGPLSESKGCGAKPKPPYAAPASAVPLTKWLESNGGLPRLRQCDIVYARITNEGDTAVDLTPLYFSRDGSIQNLRLGETGDGELDIRMKPGSSRNFFFRAVTATARGFLPIGQEQLAVIAVPARTNAPPADYRYLAQGTPPTATRGTATNLDLVLDEAGFGVPGRRGPAAVGAEDAAVLRSTWVVEAP